MITEEVYALAAWVTAPCGRAWTSEGGAQAIITNAAARMSKPTAPVSQVAFACSLLMMAAISPPRLPT